MNLENLFVVTPTYLAHSKDWIRWLKYSESVVIVFPYLSDRSPRIIQFCDDLEQKFQIHPIYHDPNIKMFDEYEDFETFINISSLPNKKNTLVIINGDSLFHPQHIQLLNYIQVYRLQHLASFTTLIALESDPYSALPTFFPYNLIFQNLDYYPLYSDSDLEIFISYLCQKWTIKISPKEIANMTSISAGSFWLAKEIVRIYRNEQSFSQTNPDFLIRLEAIAKSFSPTERSIILSAPKLERYSKLTEYHHLKKIGYLTDEDLFRVSSTLVYVHAFQNRELKLKLSEGKIYFRNFEVSSILSKNESLILKLLMEHPKTAITRDKIGSIIWKKESDERFSTWAIDQATKRLRDKLVKLGLPATTIKSVRGIGYEYRE